MFIDCQSSYIIKDLHFFYKLISIFYLFSFLLCFCFLRLCSLLILPRYPPPPFFLLLTCRILNTLTLINLSFVNILVHEKVYILFVCTRTVQNLWCIAKQRWFCSKFWQVLFSIVGSNFGSAVNLHRFYLALFKFSSAWHFLALAYFMLTLNSSCYL